MSSIGSTTKIASWEVTVEGSVYSRSQVSQPIELYNCVADALGNCRHADRDKLH